MLLATYKSGQYLALGNLPELVIYTHDHLKGYSENRSEWS